MEPPYSWAQTRQSGGLACLGPPLAQNIFILSNYLIRNTKECPHGGGAVNSQDSKEMQMNTLLDCQ